MIKIFTTQYCGYCRMAKNFLDRKKIKYQEFDVAEDAKAAKEMVELSGQRGVPVMVIGKKIIVGFDEKEIERALAEKEG